MKPIFILTLLLFISSVPVQAQDRAELESIFIKGNKEFPQILYIVPWKDMKTNNHQEQTLVLHSLFGNLFDPVDEVAGSSEHQPSPSQTAPRH